MKKAVKTWGTFRCVTCYPDDFSEGKHYPVILFLHGAGARGTDISLLESNAITQYFRTHQPLPFVLAEPLCEDDTWFEVFEQLIAFTAYVHNLPYTDKSQFYLSGNSMGGYAAWMLAMARPEWFTALVPVCGGGMTWNAARLKNLPIWAFHGMLDDVIPVEESIKMVASVNAAGGNAKLTLYPHTKHNSWDEAYADPLLYQWLLAAGGRRKTAP